MRRAWIAGLVLLGVIVLTNTTWKIRSTERAFEDDLFAADRLVDIGVNLHVVKSVPDTEQPKHPAPGRPDLEVIRTHRLGGILDTKCSPPAIIGPSEKPLDWYCSEDQEPVIFHPDSSPLGQLVYGSMGAGKTTVGVIWIYARWLETIAYGRSGWEGGITAPTAKRLEVVLLEILKMFPEPWRHFSSSTNVITLADRTRLRGMSTYRQSEAQGTSIAGFTWPFGVLADEAQDQTVELMHIDARCRGGRIVMENNRKISCIKQLRTATAKDESDWRTERDRMDAAKDINGKKLWERRTLYGPRSPFLPASHWKALEAKLSEREYKRIVGAEDLMPELAVYYGWLRTRNLVPYPQIAKDVTSAVLAGYPSYLYPGRQFGLLCSHDPGVIYNTTEVMRLIMFGQVPTWVVVGELQTKQTTARQHGAELRKYLRDEFYVHHPTIGGPLPILFCDPHGKGEAQTDYQSVYMAFQKEGLDVFNPAGIVARIQRKARVEMMNRLLGGAADRPGVPRLVVALDAQSRPVAPKLVEAFESLKKKPGDENPEGSRSKDLDDKTHAPAAAAYGLWQFEQEALTEHTVKTARGA